MLRSLRTRLLLMVVAVITLAGVATWVMFGSLTTRRLEEFEAHADTEQLAVFGKILMDHYFEGGGSWHAVGPLLDRFAEATQRMAILVIPGPQVMFAPSSGVRDAQIAEHEGGGYRLEWHESDAGEQTHGVLLLVGGARIEGNGELVAELFFGPNLSVTEMGEHRVALTGSVNRSAAIAVAIAAITALLLAFALSRRILGPVEALTAAVRRMSSGDLDQRVDVRSKDEIGELAIAFNVMADNLNRMERLRRDMTTDVAHELRTPVTNIRAQLEAMQDGLLQTDGAALESLHEEIMHLGGVIDDLQDLSIAESGQLKLDLRSLSAREELGRAVAAAAPVAEKAGIALEVEAAAALPTVRADALRLGQVLRNLIGNALAHTPRDGRVTIRALAAEGAIAFEVSDTGPGIEARHLSHVFERFYRVDASRTRETGGAGLGLPIARQLVMAMGGSIEALSDPGHGATFRFMLPLA